MGGFVRWSLVALLPFVILALIRSTSSTQTIEIPKNFCEIDARELCSEGKCIRYDPKKFSKANSIMTYFPGGRLGNMITAYLTLLWMKLEFGYDVYFEKEAYQVGFSVKICFSQLYMMSQSLVICLSLLKTVSQVNVFDVYFHVIISVCFTSVLLKMSHVSQNVSFLIKCPIIHKISHYSQNVSFVTKCLISHNVSHYSHKCLIFDTMSHFHKMFHFSKKFSFFTKYLIFRC